MKNIHVLPTDKPSRLRVHECGKLYLSVNFIYEINDENKRNIYITSDEEIKEGDWFLNTNSIGELDGIYEYTHKCLGIKDDIISSYEPKADDTFTINSMFCKKIILTTDQDLIKDGVQAINDEFLEWFVKNPSCEWIKVEHERVLWENGEITHYKYKIIISKKETDEKGQPLTYWGGKEEPKQETIEEAATNYANAKYSTKRCYTEEDWHISWLSFRKGAKWQEQNSDKKYSEEEVRQMLCQLGNILYNKSLIYEIGEEEPEIYFDDIIEQFKKK